LNEYRKYIEEDPVFKKCFRQVLIKEPTVIDCVSILRGLEYPIKS
jgi:ATP-dependent Clp protease ATP-binding subunit ClpB